MEVRTVSLATFIVATAAATIGMMVSLAFLVFHVYHRNNKIVKMSSPMMNVISSFGAIFLNVVCFLYGLEYIVDSSMTSLSILCQIRVWLFVFAVTLLFSPVAAKTWRVRKIFKYGFAKKVVIRDVRLLFMIMCMLIVDCTLLTLWQTIDPSTAHRFVYSIQDMGTNGVLISNTTFSLDECTCSNYSVWAAVIGIWKSVIFAICLYFAWKVKTVSVPGLNDAAATFTAVFLSNAVMVCAMLGTTTLLGNKNSVYIVTTIGIATSGSLTQIILFFPKVLYWWRTPENISPRISTATLKDKSSPVPDQLSGDGDVNGNLYMDEGLQDIVEENKQLKDSLLEQRYSISLQKEELITTMQDHLELAKHKLTMLPVDMDTRHQSAFENVSRSLSNDDIYETLRPKAVSDRSGLYRVDGGANDAEHTHHEPHIFTSRPPNLRRTRSLLSSSSEKSFIAEFTDIRNSIAAEIDTASVIHDDLRRSVTRDLDRPYSATEWLYESRQSQELAGSIAQSYNLGDNQELFSYINNYLPRENTVFQIRSSRRTSRGSSAMSFHSSADNMSSCNDVDTFSSTNDVAGTARDSETPNSQQHAAILRYYSYRHINDGFQRFQSSRRYNKNIKSTSIKRKEKERHQNIKRENSQMGKLAVDLQDPRDVYSAPKRKPRVWTKWSTPKDSFV